MQCVLKAFKTVFGTEQLVLYLSDTVSKKVNLIEVIFKK